MKRRSFIHYCSLGGCSLALKDHTQWLHPRSAEFARPAWESLRKYSREAQWYETARSGDELEVYCLLCPRECELVENQRGHCRTRVVKGGKLYTIVYGNPCSVNVDPMEKKPLFHFLPGTEIFSIATAGCNLRCLNCQNWQISQSNPEEVRFKHLPPEKVVEQTLKKNIPSIAYTYSEPIAFYDYTYDTAIKAREQKIRNVLVTAGYILPEPLRKLCKVVDAANVDLKFFNNKLYKKVSRGKLKPVLETLEIMREEGVWVEVTNLLIPSLSDNFSEIQKMAKWLVEHLGPGTPLHFSRFHPAYQLKALPPTPRSTLNKARQIALDAGLHHVYIGNLPGSKGQNTVCSGCKEPVIKREGYTIISNNIRNGKCSCGEKVPGVWS